MRRKIFVLVALMTFIFSYNVEAGLVGNYVPFQCYVERQIDTYNNPGDGRRAGWISANVDLIRVTQVRSDGWAYGDYPGANGKRVSRWFRLSDICADPNYPNRSANVKGAQQVFRTSSSGNTIGSVSNNESVIVLADNGNRAQILYRLDNGTGYKIGWVPSSTVADNRSVNPAPNNMNHNPQGTVEQANSPAPNTLHVRGKAYDLDNARASTRLHVYVGGGAGSGAPSYEIRTDGNSGLFDDTRTVERTGRQHVYIYALNDYGAGENKEIWNGYVDIQGNPTQINLNVGLLKQNDRQWKDVVIKTNTIGKVGCTITSLTMKYNYHNNQNITPPQMMRKLSFYGNGIVWDSVRALGYTTDIVEGHPQPDNEWLRKIYVQLKAGKPVIIGAYKTTDDAHWVVVKGYNGNSTTNFSAVNFQINDPMNPFTNLQEFFSKYKLGLRGIVY